MMKDEAVNHERRRILSVGAAVFATPLLGVGVAHARGIDAGSGFASGEPTPKSPERVAEFEAGIQLGAETPVGPLQVFAPLALGDELGFGWRLKDVRAPERGAILVMLSRDVDTARVHVCRNGGCPAGVASTDQLDFLLMNRGGGGETTDEDLGRALFVLAGYAAQSGVRVEGLMTHEERIERWVGDEPGALQ